MVARTEAARLANIRWTVEYNKKRREQRNEWLRQWCKRNPQARFKRYLRHRLKSKYHMTEEDYSLMLEQQAGKCQICKCQMHVTTEIDRTRNGKSVTVDHDAITGKVRGLLCNNCNRAIGLLEHNPAVLQSAIEYLADNGR